MRKDKPKPYFYGSIMKLKLFFGDKPVYLCDEKDAQIEELLHHPDTIFTDELSSHAIHAMLHEIKKESFHAGVILHDDIVELKKKFFHHFTCVEAAGGIVLNEQRDLLMIFRRGKWDLPKGKLDAGEDPAAGALRETEEETAVTGLTLRKKIGETYHAYDEFGKHVMKTTHWYFFTCTGRPSLQPQTNEDITEAKWVASSAIAEPMANTYASIREILSIFFDTP